MPTIALFTGSLYTYGLARVFALAAEAGFEAIEILVDHRWDCRQPTYLRRLSQVTNLPIAAVHSPFKPFVPGWPCDPLGCLRETAAVAREVGAPVVVAHLPLRIRGVQVEFFGLRTPVPGGWTPAPGRIDSAVAARWIWGNRIAGDGPGGITGRG